MENNEIKNSWNKIYLIIYIIYNKSIIINIISFKNNVSQVFGSNL
jgi:hypothetical protein